MTPAGLRTGLFVADTNIAAWRDTMGDFSFFANSLSTGIQTPTTFAGITRVTPPMAQPQTPAAAAANEPANAAMERVASRFVITDMVSFDPTRHITANEFNNIVGAIIQGNTSVTMNATLPAATAGSMNRNRMYVSGSVERERALDIMVRLYEIRTNQMLVPMTDISSIPGAQNASVVPRILGVAADIGFITDPLEPRGTLTMGEMMSMVDIIILDSGM
jgi:hypothetical protein